jgi:rhamnosyltransferase
MRSPAIETDRSLLRASVVVRARDKEATIGRTLQSLRQQSIPVEIVVVDSGSKDATVDIARTMCDELLRIPSEQFSFGRALNLGAERASAPVVVALSAHCVAPDRDWVMRLLTHYADPQVAGVSGQELDPFGRPLLEPWRVRAADVRTNPHWGFSNTASSWRRTAWERIPFNEDISACEDKEWMWRVLKASLGVVIDPAVNVPSAHRRQAGIRALWRREVIEHEAIASSLDQPVPGLPAVLGEWWSRFPYPSDRPRWQRRLSPWRTAEIFGGLVGDRRGRARRSPDALSFGEGNVLAQS